MILKSRCSSDVRTWFSYLRSRHWDSSFYVSQDIFEGGTMSASWDMGDYVCYLRERFWKSTNWRSDI